MMTLRIEPTTRADGEDGSDSSEAPISVAISSEAEVERYDWWKDEKYLEVLGHEAGQVDLSYARDGLPFCMDHDLRRQVGLLRNVRLDDDGILRGELVPGNHPDAAWAMADIRAGIRTKVSVGYDPGDAYRVEAPAAKGGLPRRIYTKWMPMECSSVSVPADYEVGIGRSADAGTRDGRDGLTPTAPRKGKDGTMPDQDIETPETGARAADAAVAAARSAETARIRGLRSLGEIAEIDTTHVERWIGAGTTVEDAQKELAEAKRKAAAEGAPYVFARSAPGAVGRDGSVKQGWDEPAEFFRAVASAGSKGGVRIDPRLVEVRAVTGANEGVGSEGGFAVPKEILSTIVEPVYEQSPLLSRVSRVPVTGSGIKYPMVDETSRTDGNRYGGITSQWASEGQQGANSKAKWRMQELDLKKLIALAPATSEILEDAPFMSAKIPEWFTNELRFKGEAAAYSGDGQGKPLGMTQGGAFVTQAIEATQTIANSAQFIATNLAKMKARFMGDWNQAIWFYNIELFPTLMLAKLDASSGAVPLFIPAGGLGNAQFDLIFGRPAVPLEYAEAPGTVGDITLVDPSKYDWAEKSLAPKITSSAHLRFDYDEEVFKLTWRVDGQPQPRTAVTPYKGSSTRSPFIGLATRS